ncbi:MAG: 3-oxoacid CoA-transferase subunit B [Bdellovibrionota bacterium]|nr:3-oxoacid CoA-transferase subunit B [Bdellovibrionota bacterium]
MTWSKEQMADKVISLFENHSTINLGIGLPTLIAERIPKGLDVMIHSENGVLGVKGRPHKDHVSPTLINAGKETIDIGKGASFFDSALSFGMIRGGHLDYCVLGGMEVDIEGNLANWMIPGKKVTGMGGAMDLVHGAKTIIVMMTHFNKAGRPKLLEKCQLPLTGLQVVDLVVTDKGIFSIEKKGFKVKELADGIKSNELGLGDSLIKE